MPVKEWNGVVYAVRQPPTGHRLGILECGVTYVGRYARWAATASSRTLRTTTVREPVTCLSCLAEDE